MTRMTKLGVGALAALAIGGAAAPAAQADSIAYIRDANVWLASGDGARRYQVTATGGYSSVSQADDGTLVALFGNRHLHRIDRVSGAVTADFATPVSDTPPNSSFVFSGPFTPQISPDGTRVAYGFAAQYTRYDPYCGYPGGCKEGKLIVGTGYSHADRLTSWDEPGFKMHSGWQWPSWLDNQHVVISQPVEIGNLDAWVDTVGDDQYGERWFGVSGDYDVEVSRANNAILSISSGGKFLNVDKLSGPWPSGTITECLFVGDREGPTYHSPSFSPDGQRIAWDDGASVHVMSNLDWAGCNWDAPVSTVLDAGTSPDWGPADLPPARPVDDGRRGEEPRQPQGRDPSGSSPRPRPVRNALGARIASASLSRGVTVRFSAPAAGRLAATARARGRVVATGSRTVARKGAATVGLRFSRAGRRALRRGGRVSVALTFKPRRGAAKRVSLSAVVRAR